MWLEQIHGRDGEQVLPLVLTTCIELICVCLYVSNQQELEGSLQSEEEKQTAIEKHHRDTLQSMFPHIRINKSLVKNIHYYP